MKKNLLITLLFVFAAFFSNAQITNGGFEAWSGANPDGWGGTKTATTGLTIAKVTANVHGGVNAVGLTNTTSSHKRFTSAATTVTSGTAYVISFWVRGTTGQIRTGMFTGKNASSSGYLTYNPYVSVTASWTQVTQTLIADCDTAIAEFIISVGNMGDVVIDDVTVTAGTVSTVSIHDIQYSTTPPYISAYNGMPVITGGIVTAKYNKGIFIQDATGPWNGIYVYDSAHVANAGIAVGDSIVITATVSEYLTYTELTGVSNIVKVSSGNTLHPAYAVTKANNTTEELEGVLVSLTNLPCVVATGSPAYGEWIVKSGTDSTKMGGLIYKYTTAAVGVNYDIKGVVYLAYGGVMRVEPRDATDVSINSGINEYSQSSVNIYPNPANSLLNINNIDGVSSIRISNILGATIQNVKVSGSNTTIDVSSLPNGIYFVTMLNQNNIVSTKKFSKQ